MNILAINNRKAIYGGADAVFRQTVDLLRRETGIAVYELTIDDVNNYVPYKDMSPLKRMKKVTDYFFNFKVYKAVKSLCANNNIDVVHGHLVFGGGLTLAALVAAKRAGAKVVLTLHDYKLTCPVLSHLDRQGTVCISCIEKNNFQAVMKRCFLKSNPSQASVLHSVLLSLETTLIRLSVERLVAVFVFVSQFSLDLHKRKYHFKQSKVRLLPNNSLVPAVPLPRNQENFDFDMAYFGRMSAEKGVEDIIAYAEMRPRIRIALIGNDAGFEKGHVPENVAFLGFLQGRDLTNALSRCRWTVLNSKWFENNPLAVLESFRLGIPVLGAKIGGIPELVQDGINGMLFESLSLPALVSAADKALVIDEVDYKKLRQGALAFAENAQKDNYLEKLISIYEEA